MSSNLVAKGKDPNRLGGLWVDKTLLQSRNSTPKGSRSIGYIVVHYTGNFKDTAFANARYFKETPLQSSAHYFVDEKTLYQSVELCNVAWHCGTKGSYYHPTARNSNSIGIEMCCSGGYRVVQKTIDNTVNIVADLLELLGYGVEDVDRVVLRHYDITRKQCPLQFATIPSEWVAFKELVKLRLKAKEQLRKAEEAGEVVEQSSIIVDGKTVVVQRILKDGVNYIKVRDLANALGLEVSAKGSIPVLTTKK